MADETRPGSMPVSGPSGWKNSAPEKFLLTSMDRDGTKTGYDLGLTRAISDLSVDSRDRLGRRRKLGSHLPGICRGKCQRGVSRLNLSLPGILSGRMQEVFAQPRHSRAAMNRYRGLHTLIPLFYLPP